MLLVNPFDNHEEELSNGASGLKNLGGDLLGSDNASEVRSLPQNSPMCVKLIRAISSFIAYAGCESPAGRKTKKECSTTI
jgi:hypothetical protein